MALVIKSNAQLDQEEVAKAKSSVPASPVLSSLASHVLHCFGKAEMHRQSSGVTDRILKSRRLKSGVYEGSKLTAIRQHGGSELFFNITETKCEAFEAWMEDVFAPVGDKVWDAKPTPIPSLPKEKTIRVYENAIKHFMQLGEQGYEPSPTEVQEFTQDLYDITLQMLIDDAKERCERMVRKMEDQTQEGGFFDAFKEFTSDLGTYPSAIFKGPVFERKKRLVWENGKVEVKEVVAPTWRCVDPFWFFMGPNARHVNESYVCEITNYDRAHLSDMRDLPGWSRKDIEAVLADGPKIDPTTGNTTPDAGHASPQIAGESEMAGYEDREQEVNSGQPDSTLRAIEFWGRVQGSMLIDWGMSASKVPDKFKYYEVTCVLIDNNVVRAVLNPDPLGRRPYFVSSFIKNKNSVWGLSSVSEKMEDCQEGVNGATRNLMNNLALASGPQVAVDLDALPASEVANARKMAAWKVWLFHGQKAIGARKAIDFFQPDARQQELMEVIEFFEKKADDRTLIPRYVYGNEDMKGAGATASGLSMLMSASNRGIKRVIKNIDRDVLRPAIERLYTWNMRYLEEESLKGDVQIVPKGALAMLVREQTQMRRQEFLNMTNNPIDLQIIGIEGRAAILRKVAQGLDMEVDDIIPTEEEMKQRVQAMLMQQGAGVEEQPTEEAA